MAATQANAASATSVDSRARIRPLELCCPDCANGSPVRKTEVKTGETEVRPRRSSRRAPAASGWTAARQRLSPAPSCWSSRARALSAPREGESRRQSP